MTILRNHVVAVMIGLSLLSCSLPVDDQASVIPQTELPDVLRSDLATTPTVTVAPGSTTEPVTIYLLAVVADRSVVMATSRDVDQSADFEARIGTLFGTEIRTDAEKEMGWSNALREFVLLNASVNENGIAIIDMVAVDAEGLPITVEARLLADAAAQLVYTATSLTKAIGVRILIDGETAFLPTAGGDTKQVVSTSDFERYDPDYVPTTTTSATSSSVAPQTTQVEADG